MNVKEVETIAEVLRRDVLLMTSAAGSGHLTSSLSCADIIASLFFSEMRYDARDSSNPDNDEFILSKGHASPVLYSALFRSGCINTPLEKLRKLESPLEGHPIPSSIGWIKAATGSLGQGLSIAAGIALAAKLQKRKFRTFCLLGDSEFAEGSNYEALQFASFYELNNLCIIIDVNRLGQRGETMLGNNTKEYQSRLESFGWQTLVIDGHNIKQIISALESLKKSQKPLAIIAKTIKGKGISFLEDKNGWHGKALSGEELKKALKQIPETQMPFFTIKIPEKIEKEKTKAQAHKPNIYDLGKSLATREAYGKALASLAKSNPGILALDAEVSNSTYSDEVKKQTPRQFIESFIMEQNMLGVSQGLAIKGYNVFASSFAAFLTRAHDQLRMAAISTSNLTLCGSHCGVSIGEDGASQMGLEDIEMFRSLPLSTILYPCDAVSTEKLVQQCSQLTGIKYIRTTRAATPVIYNNNEQFPIGDFKILRQFVQKQEIENKKSKKSKKVKSKKSKSKETEEGDTITLIGAGITLHECLKAHEELKKRGIHSAVIDLYCIKPLNTKKLLEFVKAHGNKLVIAEDHYKEGGIGEMISAALANSDTKLFCLAVNRVPHSGTKDQLLDKYRINAAAIIEEVRTLLVQK